MLLDHPDISRHLFYSRPSYAEPTLPVSVDGAVLDCFRHQRHSDAGTVLYFHGNGELAAEYAEHYAENFRNWA